jgi:hypothetical protein
MSGVDIAIANTLERVALTMRATVYTGNSWSTVDKTGLKCSLTPVNRQPAATGAARAELAAIGDFSWERGYTMPANSRVLVDAYPEFRWNVRAGTIWPDFGPGGDIISWHADVVRAA